MSRIIWITGVAGSGKSTLATALCARWSSLPRPVHLDGGRWREILGSLGMGFGPNERLAIGSALARLAVELSDQGVSVVASTISAFAEVGAILDRARVPVLRVRMHADRAVLARRRPEIHTEAQTRIDLPWPYRVDRELRSDQGLTADELADALLSP